MAMSMGSNLSPNTPLPTAPPTYEQSSCSVGEPPKTIQIFGYRVDVDRRHFSSQSSPGVKFTQYGECYSTRPHAKSDLDAISTALPQFDCDIREWQQTRHSTLDQTLKLQFPYPPKALWSVVHLAVGIYTASVRCLTPASSVEAELHYNNNSFALSQGRSFIGGLHAVTFCCPPDIRGPAYVVFTFKDRASLVVDQEICIITQGKREIREPIEVPLAVRNPLDESMISNMGIEPAASPNSTAEGRQSDAQQNDATKCGGQQRQPQQNDTQPPQMQSPAINPVSSQSKHVGSIPNLPTGCPPAKTTTLCNVNYVSPYPTCDVDSLTTTAQQPQSLQSSPFDVAPIHNTSDELPSSASNVESNLVFLPTIRYDPSKAAIPGNTGFESGPSPISSIVKPRFGIPHTKLELEIARVIDQLLWERRDVIFSELTAKLPAQVVAQWSALNSRWLGRKRVLEKLHSAYDLSTLFKDSETRRQRQPRKRSQKQPSPPRSPRSFPIDVNYPGLCRSIPLTLSAPVVAQATAQAIPFRPTVPSAPAQESLPTTPFPPAMSSPMPLEESGGAVLRQH